MVEWQQILNGANTGVLGLIAYLLAKGILVPMSVVKDHMLAPRDDRIQALEEVSKRKEQEAAELHKMHAEALKATGAAMELIARSTQRGPGV